jgi:type I restriction enzyme M protein
MVNNHYEIEKHLWAFAYNFLAKSKPKSSGYSVPGLGLIFLHYADHKFAHAEKEPLLEASP